MRHTKTRALCECAILLALSVVLSFIQIYKLPWGGSVTLFSMLPLCLISFRHGIKWGLGTAFCYSWFQILQGGVFGWGLTPIMLVGSLALDYVLAFTVIGLAGALRRYRFKGMIAGVVLVSVLRFLSHFLSGVILWANLEQFVAFGQTWSNRPVLYSLVYNGSYMLPELALTVIGAVVLFQVPQIARLIEDNVN